jgi:hypothetical protein
MKIASVKCDDGRIFINEDGKNNYDCTIKKLLFDGVLPEKSWCENWYIIRKEPTKLQKQVQQSDINYRYELIDKDMVSDKVPLVFKREEAATYSNYEWVWKDKFAHLKSLYSLVSDPQPDILEDVPFEFIVLMNVKDISTPSQLSYAIQKTQWKSEGTIELDNNAIEYQLLDRLVFPAPLLPQRPCRLSSVDTYKIVREYVRQNINPQVAEITSDYDFCFAVTKKIPLSETVKYTVDTNFGLSGKRKKSKHETRYRSARQVECFEMTDDIRRYDRYTPIKGFEGKNHEDLKEKIDKYLKNLIEFINEPLKDCPHCKGLGVIYDSSLTPRVDS